MTNINMSDIVVSTGQAVAETQQDLYLTFHLNGENYAIPIHLITEIIGIQKITRLPDMPECIQGIINLRGRVFPVLDVRVRFGMVQCEYDDRTCIIVVNINDQTTGIIVDRVNEVVEIAGDQVEPPPHYQSGQQYIQGVGKIGDRVNILLDLGVLVDLDIEISQEALDQLAAEPA
ncbi:MAG: chemotaxis protein CheW [Thermodesulfobacteriota bacterium]|nr:chemotaxis protein CheW [Thermodesulfobacteriota bacterium]